MSIIQNNTNFLYESLFNTSQRLHEIPECMGEFTICHRIMAMAGYVFKHEEILYEHFDFVADLIIGFYNLLNDKLDWLLSTRDFDYEIEFKEFKEYVTEKGKYYRQVIHNHDIENSESIVNVLKYLR